MNKPLCALTMGDPAGIGPEVALKTLFSQRAKDAARLMVIGYPGPFKRDAGMLSLDVAIREIESPVDIDESGSVVNLLVPDRTVTFPLTCGIVDASCGRAAGACIVRSAELALDGLIDAVVTAPINKESLNLGGYSFPGHTEMYRHLTGAPDIAMLLTLGTMRVIHVVTHEAMRNVPDLIRRERIVRVAELMYGALVRIGVDNPRIAVSGLNPHAGEGGMFGSEEADEIAPAVVELRNRGIDADGPIPPDTVFARAYSGEFDGVVAMYHDQGHIALKLLGFRLGEHGREVGGVNTTLGLPIIRTSVDHGTAFDIAGRGVASPESMIEAVEMAARLAHGREL